MKAILTGQKTIGQTQAVGRRTRRGAVPEWVTTPSGERKYVGSAYKSTGQRGFLDRLLGSRGYRGTVGTGTGFFDKRSSIGKYNPVTGLYESEEEDVGNIKPGFGGRILGGLTSLATGIPFVGPTIGGAIDRFKPKGYFEGLDPSEQRRLNALNLTPLNEQKISLQNDMPMENLAMYNMGKTPNITGTDQDYQTALGEGWATNYTGTDTNNDFVPQNLPLYPGVGQGAAEGGRIGYADRGFVEDINVEGPGFDENVMMASDESNDRILESLYEEHYDRLKGLGHDDRAIHEIIMGMFEEMSTQAPDSEDQGLASLV
jgi:hypothetical protein